MSRVLLLDTWSRLRVSGFAGRQRIQQTQRGHSPRQLKGDLGHIHEFVKALSLNGHDSANASAPRPIGQARRAAPEKLVTRQKKLIRHTGRDYSQLVRRSYQALFLLLNVWLGGTFYFWVRGLETGAATSVADPPAGIEGWLPIAGLMNLKYFLVTGRVPAIHPAAMFLLISFLAMSFLLRKAFCSWLCPIGTISEYLGLLGQKLFKRNFRIWRWLDTPLRGLKYLLLAFFVWAISSMSAEAIAGFMQSDYGVVAGVKMLNFFRFLGGAGLLVLGILVLVSVFVRNFWCRYLCPYGALLGFASLVSPLRVRREPETCIDCAKCAKFARPACRWTSSSPSGPPSARAASRAWRFARPKARCTSRCHRSSSHWSKLPKLRGTFLRGPSLRALRCCSLELWATRKRLASGARTFARRCIAQWRCWAARAG